MNQKSKKNRSRSMYLAALGAITAPLCISSLNANATTSVPTYLTQEATSINVTVTDRVTFNVLADSNTATVSSITVANNLTSVPVVVSNIQATAQAGYNLEAYSTDFSTYDTGSNHFGIAYTRANESDEDISGTGYATDEEIAAEGNHVFTFAGKSSAYSTAVAAASNTQIANIILTLGMKPIAQTALTIQDLTYMQDFKDLSADDKAAVLSSMEDNTTYNLIDNRDNKTYQVAKLKDGNIWMAENLDLGRTTLTNDLTSSNTNLSETVLAATFNGWKKTSGTATSDAGEFINVSGTDAINGTAYGTLYNYFAASAGTISGSSNSNNAQYDICPAGWRLPTGGSGSEFAALETAYNSTVSMYVVLPAYDYEGETNIASLVVPIANGGASFALAGGFGNSAPDLTGIGGHYWSSTNKSGTKMYDLYVSLMEGYGDSSSRNGGYPIRCIAQ